MTHNNNVDAAIERIVNIKWELNDTRFGSHIALLREYLRRASLWAQALTCTDKWPFFDVAAQLDPLLCPDKTKIETLERHLQQFNLYRPIKRTCEWYIHWVMIEHKPAVVEFDLPDPYEPLIIMYERGGDFYTEHGFFQFPVGSFPIGNWKQYSSSSPKVELDEHVLDQLDRTC